MSLHIELQHIKNGAFLNMEMYVDDKRTSSIYSRKLVLNRFAPREQSGEFSCFFSVLA